VEETKRKEKETTKVVVEGKFELKRILVGK